MTKSASTSKLKLINEQNWNNKYSLQKLLDYSNYSKKTLEIQDFLCNFFKQQNLEVQSCKVYFLPNSLNINILYRKNFIFKNSLDNATLKKLLIKLKNKKYFNNSNFWLVKKLVKSLTLFTKKKYNIFIALQNTDNKIENILQKKTKVLFKKKFNNFRMLKEKKLFKVRNNILLTSALTNNSSFLLTKFIATSLSTTNKTQKTFLKFVKQLLQFLRKKNFTTFKGIKIQIKGRINSRPRAKLQKIFIGKKISLISLKSNINYSEKTAFTKNGSIGIKVWVEEF